MVMMIGVWVDMGCIEYISILFLVNIVYEGFFWIRVVLSMEFGEKFFCLLYFQFWSYSMIISVVLMQRDGIGLEDGIGNNVVWKQ